MSNTQSTKIQKLVGKIISHKMAKTAVVEVMSFRQDPKYHKRIATRKTYFAHDETDQYKTGDLVEIAPSRPLARSKRFTVVRKLS